MDAEVLSPPTMADINGNSKLSTAELEVLKLQELVRKLERQNEQLRTRANAVNNCSVTPLLQTSLLSLGSPGETFASKYPICSPTQTHPGSRGARSPAEEPIAYFQPSSASPEAAAEEEIDAPDAATVLDELEDLDLDAVLPVGEADCWLYESSKAKLQGERGLSPLQWCRQVLDRPGPEVELARMTLCHRLDQAKRWRSVSSVRPYSCIEGLSTISCPVLPYSKSAALTESPASPSGLSVLQPPPSVRPSCGLSDRTPTFLSNSNMGRRHAAVSPQSSVDSEAGVSELEEDSISMSYKLQDMTDVEVMARLQEESLRQDCASTSASASRRSSSFSLNSLRRSEMDLEEEDEDDEGYDQLPPPQPRLFRTGSMQHGSLRHSHTFSSIRDCRRSSASSQFSLSGLSGYSSGSSFGLNAETPASYRSSADKLRRSMPNLIRAPSMPTVPAVECPTSPVNPPSHGPSSLPMMSSLRTSQSFDSSNGLIRLQSSIPSPGQLTQRVQSVGNFPSTPRPQLKATAYVSPTVLQGPTTLSTSTSLNSIPSSSVPPQPLKPSVSLAPQPVKGSSSQSSIPRSSLPRPASFVGISGVLRPSKLAQPRSLLTPPKSLTALSALRDASWKDGCY
ncbi:SLAIN motif-containing protein 1a isoform X1 [Synchiropus splendidus]|uniref:SLAIN motif-containing protein 1a isoform X1 n=1 Tax=Synchiropus splendidus TaxID=270530 RepID=UPI00237DA1EC|nr:SLAIN motif-containing protein 1a isoform X1 [Synchiropus splendidus]